MRPLTSSALLDAWEEGQGQSWPRRALTLLAASEPDAPMEQWAGLTIGERDRSLLLLREWVFGPSASALVTCARCQQRLEFEIDIGRIRRQATPDVKEPLHLAMDGYEIRFRLPTTNDLEVASEEHRDLESLRDALVSRCVLEVIADGAARPAAALHDTVRSAIAEQMSEADPTGDIRLGLRCPACQHGWLATFDILRFFWTEVHAWAVRLLHDVHMLAAAYGWREADVLSMTPWRRAMYLELIGKWRTI